MEKITIKMIKGSLIEQSNHLIKEIKRRGIDPSRVKIAVSGRLAYVSVIGKNQTKKTG